MGDRLRVIVDHDGAPHPPYGEYGIEHSANGSRSTGYLFSSDPLVDRAAPYALVIPALRLARGRRSYVLPKSFGLDLRRVEPDLYQIHLVQDFWTDDDNPDLGECVGAVFLGRRRASGAWEAPERWPIECRSLAILGTIDTRRGRYAFSARHGG
jgi:hypothetical protein